MNYFRFTVRVPGFLNPYPLVLGNRGCYERAPEEMLQITVQDLRHPWDIANTVRAETKRSSTVRGPGLHWGIRRSMEREIR